MENQLFVDCNDEGIPFLEARVKCPLSDVINNPVPCEMNKLIPFQLHGADEFPLGIQFNIFDCGGIGIGVCISHIIGDALSFFTFVNMWAAIARGEKKLVGPEFVSASLFPPRNLSGYRPSIRPAEEQIIITKRIDSPQPEYSFGNLYGFTVTFPSLDSTGESCDNLVSQMKDSIKKISKEYVKKIQDGYNHLDYEADFGWGKPVWASSTARDIKNAVTFMDTIDGNGIEAWVSLTEDDMAKFDTDKELLSYVNTPKSF
ncbi:hypothetical protein PTKIN_Ptkin17bG0094900 [Pterospermum kingtungense]